MRRGYLFLLFLLALIAFSNQVYAQTPMEGGYYKIEQTQVDDQTNQDSVSPPKDVKSYGSYSFEISESLIDFGQITPTNPLTRKNTVKIDSDRGYFLKAYENHQLISSQGETIPDTTCDSGSCTEKTSDVWKSTLTYGFGFNCKGSNSCGQDYLTDDTFSQFANKSRNETYNTLSSGSKGSNKINLTYKLNISSMQRPGSYSNTITMIYLPEY